MALSLLGVSKRYGGQQVLDAVSLHVPPGACYGFLGHNGAGKTTALRIALGLVRPDAGRVLVEGFDASRHPLEARARMGALVEVPGFHGALSGRANLRLLAGLQGLPRREAATEADRVLEVVGLADAAAKPAGAYSQGMRQRLGIAQALLGGPRIVLLDEPTNGLDPEGIDEIRRVLRRLTRDEGATVLLSSHQLREIADLCDRIGILRRGRLLVEEETARLLRDGSGGHVLRTGDDAKAQTVLAAMGVEAAALDGGGLEVVPGARTPAEVVRALVGCGLDVVSFAPRETTLDEIYLRYTRGDAEPSAATPTVTTPPPVAPRERIAPPGPLRRMVAYDFRRWLARAEVPLAAAAPAVAAAIAIVAERSRSAGDESDVALGSVVSTTRITAFAATAEGLRHGLPLLALVVATTAALSLAGENARGTLRNVALRPVGRTRVVVGKAMSALAVAAVSFALLVAASLAAAGLLFDFGDVVEILANGKPYVFEGYAAKDLWGHLAECLAHQAPAGVAFAGVGIAVGALARSAAGAVVGVLATTLALAGAPAFLGRGAAGWLPTGHLPWLVTDQSPTRRLRDLAEATSNATVLDGRAAWVPALWLAGAVLLAACAFRRREIA